MAAKSTTRRRTLSGARTLVALIGFLMVGQLARAAPQPEALNPGAARATPLSTPRTALRVAVMPTLAPTLASDQRELLTRLLAIQLERAGFTVVGAEGCGPPAQVHIDAGSADPSDALAATPLPPPAAPRHTLLLDRTSECLATAGAMAHVDLVALAEHAHLGDADIVTVHIYDVARGLPSRDALSSAALGDAAPALASLVDRLVARALLSFPPSEQPAIRERYEQAALGVCGDARRWFFCTGDGAALSENEAVRRYRNESKRRDLDAAEFDREPDLLPWVFLAGGSALTLGSLGLLVATAAREPTAGTPELWIILSSLGAAGGLGLMVFGIIEISDGDEIQDGTELDHVMTVEVGHELVEAHNEFLARRLQREHSDGVKR